MRQKIYSLEVVAEGRRLEKNLLHAARYSSSDEYPFTCTGCVSAQTHGHIRRYHSIEDTVAISPAGILP
jgi:hypothetical protein